MNIVKYYTEVIIILMFSKYYIFTHRQLYWTQPIHTFCVPSILRWGRTILGLSHRRIVTRRVTGGTFHVAVLSQQGRDAVATISRWFCIFYAISQTWTAHLDCLRGWHGNCLGQLRFASTSLLVIAILNLNFVLFHFSEETFSRRYDCFCSGWGAANSNICLVYIILRKTSVCISNAI